MNVSEPSQKIYRVGFILFINPKRVCDTMHFLELFSGFRKEMNSIIDSQESINGRMVKSG